MPVAALAWHGNKTIVSLSGTLSGPGTMLGNISVGSIPKGTTVTLVDAFQAMPGHRRLQPESLLSGNIPMILVPLTGLAVVAGMLLVIRRRSGGTSPKSVT